MDEGQCDSPLVVILPEESVQHCVTTCTHKRAWIQKEMIQCGQCWLWFHVECIELDKKARQTYLSCPDCRQMPSLVRIILDEIVDVKHTFNECLVTNNRLVSELTCKYVECEELKQEINTLRDRVRDISNAHNQEAWKAFQMKQLQKPELLIGSSITRDIRSTDSEKLHIITLSGACIRDVASTLSEVRGKYSRVTIQVGSNDCADRETTAEEMTEQYRRMVHALQDGKTDTTISAVLPRCNDETANERIASLNAGLQTVAVDMACAFIPHADFTLNSGKPNDGYYLDCGESNHNKNKCRFSYRLICEICSEGHKSKIHGIQNRANENKYQNRQGAYESRRTDRQQDPPRYNTYKRPRKYGGRHDNQWSTGGDRYSNTPRSEGYNRPHKYEDRRSDTPRGDEDDYTRVYGARRNVRNNRPPYTPRHEECNRSREYDDRRSDRQSATPPR